MIRALVFMVGVAVALGPSPAAADGLMRLVTGELVLREQLTLPEDAAVVVEALGPEGSAIARTQDRTEGRQSPLPFRIWVPAGKSVTLSASVEIDESAAWRSDSATVHAGAGEAALGPLRLHRAAAGFSEAAAEAEAPPAAGPADTDDADGAGAAALAEAAPAPAAEGDTEEPDAPAPGAAGERFLCGDDLVVVATDGNEAVVSVSGIDVPMRRVGAANGARFERPGDPETFFLPRGDTALVAFAGEELPECEAVGAPG